MLSSSNMRTKKGEQKKETEFLISKSLSMNS